MKHFSSLLTCVFVCLICIVCSHTLIAQERQLVKAKEEIAKLDFIDAKERLDKYAEKAGIGAEYQYVLYLLQSRQAKSYQQHVEAYETYQACIAAYRNMAESAAWCEAIQLCDTTLANENDRCYMVSFKMLESAPLINDAEDYLTRYERSPMKQDATRLRDKLRLDEANVEHTIPGYETYKSKYKTTEYVKVAQDSIYSIAFKSAFAENSIEGYKSFLVTYPNASQYNSANEKLIELEWSLTVKTATIEGYRNFLKNYPNANYRAQAEDTVENMEWSGATAANTVESYKNYLMTYPKGKFVADANTKLDGLFWDYMETHKTIESIRQFIAERPNSPRISEVNVKLEDAVWAKAQRSQVEADIRAYLAEFASGKYVLQALTDLDRSVWLRVQEQPSIAMLESYIQEFKSGMARQEAESKLEELYWQNALTAGTVAALDKFIQKYPTSQKKDKALDRIDDLKNFVLPYLNNNHKYQLYNVSQSSFVDTQEYEDMIPTSAKSFVVKKFKKYGVISKTGAIILPVKFDCMSFDGTFYQATISDKIALMGLSGEEVNGNRFSSVNKLNDKHYNVYVAGEDEGDESKCSIMDLKGEILLPFDFTSIYDIKVNNETVSYIVTKGGMQYLMDTELKVITKGYQSIAKTYFDNYIGGNLVYVFGEGGKFGVMNATGKPIITAIYDELTGLHGGLFEVVKTGKRGIIKSDNTFVFPLGNYQDFWTLSERFVTISLPNAKNQYPFFSKIYDLQKQRYISEVAYESVSLLSSNTFQVLKDNAYFILNDEGKTLLTLDEFTNSIPLSMDEEGGYGDEGMYEDGDYFCYPTVTGQETIDQVYSRSNGDMGYYSVVYYLEEKGSFEVYLDTNFKVINKPEDKYSKLLGKDLTFSFLVPSRGLMFANDENYNQYVFDLNKGTKNKNADDLNIRDFFPGYYTAWWKDALIYYPGDAGKALVGDKVDFSEFNASKVYYEGISLFYQDDFQGAINKFRESLRVFPNYADAYFQIGLCYAGMNNSYEAQKNYKEAIRIQPRNSYYIETLYDVLVGLRDWDSMLSTARNAISSGKEENATDYFYMGLAYDYKQMNNEAISAYTRAIEIDKYMAVAYHNRGIRKMDNRSYDASIKDIVMAISVCKYCSNDLLGNFNQSLGNAHSGNGDKISACKYWQKAYKLSAKYNNYLYNGCK